MDEDILILLPSDDGDGYSLKGFVNCFPAGFNTKEKLGLKLRDIHTPVPGYKQKLELSMDRFFDRLEVGKVVKRANVSHHIMPSKLLLTLSPSGPLTPRKSSLLQADYIFTKGMKQWTRKWTSIRQVCVTNSTDQVLTSIS